MQGKDNQCFYRSEVYSKSNKKKLASKIEQYIHNIFEDILKIFKIFGYFGGILKISKKNWKTLKILENFVICWEISNYNFQIMTERGVYS